MGLKSFYESEDEIPEALREHYAEDKGKFVLAIDDFEAHPKVRGVVTANNENKRKRDAAQAKLTELEAQIAALPEDFDAERWVELNANANKDDPAKRDEQLQSMKQIYEDKIAKLTKAHADALGKKDADIAERDGYIDRSLVDAGLKDSLLNVGVNPDLIDGALASLRGSVKVQRLETGDRRAIVETDLGEVGVTDFVKEWAQTKGKAYLAPPTGPTPNGSDRSRGGKVAGGDLGGDTAARRKAIAAKFPELAG